ncbi:prephenate dehydratase [Perkinsus olseni]|uniref:prephenate dehydratase n=2 Tax=Perkinsus olseni TaxID=32597 RepID=A0A7J6QKQ0_PEROL|nr:prephenate dehydratase [Perkinsus olseni]
MTALSAPILRAYRPHLTRSHLPCMRGMATHTTSHHYTIRHIGHRGSFSEIAAQSLLSLGGGRFESKFTLKGGYSSSEELLDFAPREATTEASVAAELAIAPFESSLLGPYIHIYDQLLRGGLKIFAECSQVEKHCLIGGTDETTIASIKRVYSHPWILRNSREFSDRHGFSRVEVNSTSHAVGLVAANRGDPTIAAVGSSVQAETHGLHIVKENVANDENAQTRYVVVGPGTLPDNILECPGSVPLKSAICVSIKDEPSALFKALASFALRDLNITSVVLRPLAMFPSFREALPGGSQHWDYCFYIE